MNEALPRWRTFTSAAPVDPEGDHPAGSGAAAHAASERPRPDLVALAAAALGGSAVAAAVLLILGILSAGASHGGLVASLGEPLQGGDGSGSGASTLGIWASSLEGDGGAAPGGAEIVVDVGGAVARPGLVRLRAGARVGDAIEAAGGYGPRVDLTEVGLWLNLAQPLSDGLKVVVPELGTGRGHRSDAGDGRIDLNTADQAALESLPGIGPVTAGKIIEARTQQRFAAVEELRSRGIVGEAVFADIESLVRASG